MRDFLRRICVSDRLVVVVAVLAAVFFSAVFLFFTPGYNYDVLMRYAPMADEFARGNWYYAFHPKYGCFMQVVSGSLVWLTGMTGETACKLLSTWAWCLSAIPLWLFTKRVFDRGSAWLAVALLLVMPEYWEYASAGLRDGVRILSYALIGYGMLLSPLWLGVGLFVQTALRMDGVVVGCGLYGLYLLHCASRRQWSRLLWPTVFLAASLLSSCAVVYGYTGCFVPFGHLVKFFASGSSAAASVAPAAAGPVAALSASQFSAWGEGARLTMIGWRFAGALLAASAVFAMRGVRRRLSFSDFVIMAVTFGSSAMIFMSHILAHEGLVTFWRYHYPGYVLAFGCVGYAMLSCAGKWRRAVGSVAGVAAIGLALSMGVRSIRHAAHPEKYSAYNWQACDDWAAEVIKRDWRGPGRGPREPLDLNFYVTDYRPVVFAHTARVSYGARARLVTLYRHVFTGREAVPDYLVLFGDEEKDAESFYPNLRRERVAVREIKEKYGKTYTVYRVVKDEEVQ